MSATLARLVRCRFLEIRPVTVPVRTLFGKVVQRKTYEMRLMPNATSSRHRPHRTGPVVKQGHVDGLSKMDRSLLSLLFDRIAHGERVTAVDVDRFCSENRWSYARAVREWRALVRSEAEDCGLLEEGAYTGKAGNLRALRRAVLRRVKEVASPAGEARGRLLELAIVFKADRRLA